MKRSFNVRQRLIVITREDYLGFKNTADRFEKSQHQQIAVGKHTCFTAWYGLKFLVKHQPDLVRILVAAEVEHEG